jgi:soluble lytic murein transglycosylase-like protein
MATINVPVLSLASPNTWGSRDAIKKMLQTIWTNYGVFIQKASNSSGIPNSVIVAFIAVESGGNPKAGSAGHITQGLMQWNRSYAKAQIEREIKNKDLSDYERSVLTAAGIINSSGAVRDVTNADQLKPEVNIVIGTIVLGQLLEQSWAKSEKTLHLDRIIAVYNAGAYGDTGKKARQLTSVKFDTPEKLAANVNSISASYIKKMMGVNGAMDIATSDLKNIIS